MGNHSCSFQDNCFEHQILQGVSRSFALTIPQLPEGFRGIVTNGYLLCRIADTIEDEKSLTLDQKRFFFRQFTDVVRGKASVNHFADSLYPLLSGRTLPAERELIRNTPNVIRNTLSLSERRQAALKRCATIMSRGMERFQEIKSPYGLKHLANMNSYRDCLISPQEACRPLRRSPRRDGSTGVFIQRRPKGDETFAKRPILPNLCVRFTPRALPAGRLWLKFSSSLTLNKIERFAKVSGPLPG